MKAIKGKTVLISGLAELILQARISPTSSFLHHLETMSLEVDILQQQANPSP